MVIHLCRTCGYISLRSEFGQGASSRKILLSAPAECPAAPAGLAAVSVSACRKNLVSRPAGGVARWVCFTAIFSKRTSYFCRCKVLKSALAMAAGAGAGRDCEGSIRRLLTTGLHASRARFDGLGGKHELSGRTPGTPLYLCGKHPNIRDLPIHHRRRCHPCLCWTAV